MPDSGRRPSAPGSYSELRCERASGASITVAIAASSSAAERVAGERRPGWVVLERCGPAPPPSSRRRAGDHDRTAAPTRTRRPSRGRRRARRAARTERQPSVERPRRRHRGTGCDAAGRASRSMCPTTLSEAMLEPTLNRPCGGRYGNIDRGGRQHAAGRAAAAVAEARACGSSPSSRAATRPARSRTGSRRR